MLQHIERRTFAVKRLEIRKQAAGPGTIAGHAAVFNSLSVNLGGFREKIDPGAFKRTIKESDIRALFNHDANQVLGRNKAATLRLTEDEQGLAIEIDPPDTQAARDLTVLIERGDVSQMSFGFRTITDRWETQGGEQIRTLEEVELFDVSPVTFPAYPDTDVAMRAEIAAEGQAKLQSQPEGRAIAALNRELDLAEAE